MFGRGRKKTRDRIEPRFNSRGGSAGGDLRADPADRPPTAGRKRKAASSRSASRPKRGRRRSLIGHIAYWGLVLSVWGAVALAALVAYNASQLPPIDQLAVPRRPPNIAILSDDGSLIANRGDTGGPAVRLIDLPPYLPNAFVAIEDKRFYEHHGIDPLGVSRALLRDVIGGASVEGGSTLTQQLAKNLFLTRERTLSRKIQEAILAFWLERRYSKDQILELYLNRVYFGSGAYGVEAAAQKYFGKSARFVTLSEAAVLAGLMKSPTRLAPDRNLKGANERAAQVITAMAEQGHITEAMAKAALANPAEVKHDKSAGSINYAADYVMDALNDTVGAIDEDIVVTTTINLKMQAEAERALTEELNAKGAKFGVEQGALVALDPNGAVKAMVGGRNYADSQFNRAVAAKRQPGSSFKPFVYLAALEKGLTPDTVRDDAPITVKGWRPENYSREYFGPVTLTKALALSLNTVAVRLGLEVGPKAVVGGRTPARHHLRSRSCSLDRARLLGRDAARNGVRLRRLRQWRRRRSAACDRARANGGRQAALRAAQREFRPRHRSAICGDDEPDDAGDPPDRHRAQGRTARLAGRWQDGDQPGLARRLVHRLHELPRRWSLARQRRRFADPESLGRQSAGRNLEPVHESGA